MKKTITTLFLYLFILKIHANEGDTSKVVLKETIALADTVSYATVTDTVPFAIDEEEFESMDAEDSMISFPANELYSGWDTTQIHSPKFNIETLKDSIKRLMLCDENSCGYVHPFTGNVTSNFGPRRRRYHYGIDIDLETGDDVRAAFDGKVRIAKKSKSYGNVIVIRHNNGLETYYAHLSKLNVGIGQEVFAGDVIGLGGNTGRSRGSHLHFEVRYLGQPINPNEMISFKENKLVADTFFLSKKTFNYIAEAKKVAASGRVHVVKRGDTLSGIARKYRTTTKALCKKNKIKSTSILRLGQKIKI